MADATAVRELSEQQTEAFDVEYVTDDLWAMLAPLLARQAARRCRLLDVGGGNGRFADRLLEAFPQAEAVVVEPSATLARRNAPHPRKRVLEGAFPAQPGEGEPFDLISFNWVLHHFVCASHRATRRAQVTALARAAQLLSRDGVILVFENFYNGWALPELPSRLIHALTASRTLRPVARRLSANTAGVGVCFHSEAGWRSLVAEAGLAVRHFAYAYDYGTLSAAKRMLLTIETVRVGLLVACRCPPAG